MHIEPKIVAVCTPTITRPYDQYLDALKASTEAIREAGWTDKAVFEVGCPYISHARATTLRKALDAGAGCIVFIDHDLSWRPEDLLRLIETPGRVVAGMYRYKKDEPEYMGAFLDDADGKPQYREDGCVKGYRVPAGFLKMTAEAVHLFMRAYPELIFGPAYNPSVDLFNHGVHEGIWYGEDMAFSRRWLAMGEDIWIQPDLELTHHSATDDYPGNFRDALDQLFPRKE